jgi:hypothetical protein
MGFINIFEIQLLFPSRDIMSPERSKFGVINGIKSGHACDTQMF